MSPFEPEESRLLAQIPPLVQRSMFWTFALQIPIYMAVGIVITFRIAGPLFSIERFLRRVAAGEDAGRCRVRENDELQDLCGLVNDAVDHLRAEGADEQPGPSSDGQAFSKAG